MSKFSSLLEKYAAGRSDINILTNASSKLAIGVGSFGIIYAMAENMPTERGSVPFVVAAGGMVLNAITNYTRENPPKPDIES